MSKELDKSSFLYGNNICFIEELYNLYLRNPKLVDSSWIEFFESYANDPVSSKPYWDEGSPQIILNLESAEVKKDSALPSLKATDCNNDATYFKVKSLVNSYRNKAHSLTELDPLKIERLPSKSDIALEPDRDFDISEHEMNYVVNFNEGFSKFNNIKVKDLIDNLDRCYASTIGVEFSHIQNASEQNWLYNQFESAFLDNAIKDDLKKITLERLIKITSFEQYLHTKFPGAKRFSIEGGESSVASLEYAIDLAGQMTEGGGVQEAVIGMAHRGRLSTLTQVLKKPLRAIFSEFMGTSAIPAELDVSGDVKYHMGYSSNHVTPCGKSLHLSLTPNPSHLEAVNAVVAGKVRAKQDLIDDNARKKVMGILIHGDAAFCGQGVVAECLAMGSLGGYEIGGILHLVVNNQVGFTANSSNTRPGRYETEGAKVYGAPIYHVNGDDVEAVLRVTRLAMEYQQTYGKDVVISIVCYRKYGHNEGDEPMYTQPLMYNVIKNKISPDQVYAKRLIKCGTISESDYEKIKIDVKSNLDKEFDKAKDYRPQVQWLEGRWKGIKPSNPQDFKAQTGVPKDKLIELGLKLCSLPNDFKANSKIVKLLNARSEVIKSSINIDWATAEQLAFASLLSEKIPIRLSGQDSSRGTFSHRHSKIVSQVDDNSYIPLNHLNENQAKYEVIDSNLSEYGVLGFEYGYSQVNPNHLVIWEAQFGDFANGAQIVFDQFISSAQTKWLKLSGLVVLLPHGFEGQGPEHSSARLERFLQLAAEDNMQIAYPTTPASYFHLLRRQIYNETRKPLIVMTPKSLLRHKFAVSKLDDIDNGTCFKPILDEIDKNIIAKNVIKTILCSGKIYYDLIEMRNNYKINNIAILRLEQLYPLSISDISLLIKKYCNSSEWIWCQEEPENMGAWNYLNISLNQVLKENQVLNSFKYIGRQSAASPAPGSLYMHNTLQEKIIKQALNIEG